MILWLCAALAGEPVWPSVDAPLTPLPLRPAFGARKKVYLSAGHGTGRNTGNTGVHGQLEEETTLAAVLDLAERLQALDRFDIVLARKGDERPSYQARLDQAVRVGADVMVELHTDARGALYAWAKGPSGDVYRWDGSPGVAVLYNEGGPIGAERAELARALSRSLIATGFLAYDGVDYPGLYINDPTPGVFIDRRGLFMLRRPPIPSVIIETHNAVDYEESLRFREARVQEAFALAVADGLTAVLYPEVPW
jgi:N-acetylmuramoyl-L-alanine amidase